MPHGAEDATGKPAKPASRRSCRRAARIEEEVGDLLFAAVNAARLLGVHRSNALLSASAELRLQEGRTRGPGNSTLQEDVSTA